MCLCNDLIGLLFNNYVLGFGLGVNFDLAFVEFMEKYFNNIGLILVYMVFESSVRHFLFVVDLSGIEVCLEVCPGLVGGMFVIPFFYFIGKDACFGGDYFSNAD